MKPEETEPLIAQVKKGKQPAITQLYEQHKSYWFRICLRYAKNRDLVPSAVIGKLCVAIFAFFFVDSFDLVGNDMFYIPLMCILCVAIPFVLVTIAPRFIPAAEVNLFFLLETIIGPIWVWMIIKEQPSLETIQGGIVIILTIAMHSFLKLKKS